mmetsp:Transcript_21970/g.48278  ORF Transcript_21970/g.48278 Transcript_21970/m.48278 type:complete len:81 (-) Transcript_21970:139-381(-)
MCGRFATRASGCRRRGSPRLSWTAALAAISPMHPWAAAPTDCLIYTADDATLYVFPEGISCQGVQWCISLIWLIMREAGI